MNFQDQRGLTVCNLESGSLSHRPRNNCICRGYAFLSVCVCLLWCCDPGQALPPIYVLARACVCTWLRKSMRIILFLDISQGSNMFLCIHYYQLRQFCLQEVLEGFWVFGGTDGFLWTEQHSRCKFLWTKQQGVCKILWSEQHAMGFRDKWPARQTRKEEVQNHKAEGCAQKMCLWANCKLFAQSPLTVWSLGNMQLYSYPISAAWNGFVLERVWLPLCVCGASSESWTSLLSCVSPVLSGFAQLSQTRLQAGCWKEGLRVAVELLHHMCESCASGDVPFMSSLLIRETQGTSRYATNMHLTQKSQSMSNTRTLWQVIGIVCFPRQLTKNVITMLFQHSTQRQGTSAVFCLLISPLTIVKETFGWIWNPVCQITIDWSLAQNTKRNRYNACGHNFFQCPGHQHNTWNLPDNFTEWSHRTWCQLFWWADLQKR